MGGGGWGAKKANTNLKLRTSFVCGAGKAKALALHGEPELDYSVQVKNELKKTGTRSVSRQRVLRDKVHCLLWVRSGGLRGRRWNMGVWDPPFGAGRLGPWVSGTSCLETMGVRDQLFGIWERVLRTSWLGPPFGTMGVWDHGCGVFGTSCLGPWEFWTGCLGLCLGPLFGATGVLDHGCLGFGTMGVWDQLGPLCWDYGCLGPAVWDHRLGPCLGPPFGTMCAWDHCLGMGVLAHRCLKPAPWALKKCAQISKYAPLI